MKKIAFLLLFCSGLLSAQVGINTTSPSAASVLHLESLNNSGTHGGFMPPVVDLTERALIPITAADDGMMIYLSDGTTRCVQFYNAASTTWIDMYCMPIPAPPSLTYYQDFENTPATPTLGYTYTGNGDAISSGNGVSPNSPMYSEGVQGFSVTNSSTTPGQLVFDTIDSSTFTTNSLSFNLASFGTVTNGADATDYIEVLVSVDGGATYSSELKINGGATNTKWDFTGSASASSGYDGDDTPTAYITSGSGDISGNADAYNIVTVTNLPSSTQLAVKIHFRNNSASETWVIDNVILSLN
jgi:hypothetical protein